MKKLLTLFLALVALAILGWFAIYKLKAPAIQADIQKRTNEALAANNLDWVSVNVDGRDVVLSGMAQTEKLKKYAVETANVYGVRQLNDNILVQSSSVAQPEPSEAKSPPAVTENKTETSAVPAAEEKSVEAAQQSAEGAEKTAKVDADQLQVKTKAIPYRMNIVLDEAGVYQFDGVIPNTDFKREVDAHLISLGSVPSKARWQVDTSSEEAPANWQENTLKSLSALHLLKEGNVSFEGDKALIKGVAMTQDASDQAEAFAQGLAGDFGVIDVAFEVPTPEEVAKAVEPAPMVGSSKYAEKFCQTEFNGLLKKDKIQFESGSTVLQRNSLVLLDKVSKVATRCPDHQIQIHGYTDSNGAGATNKELSKVRAEAVLHFLAGLGISEERLLAVGHGEEKPIASNKTENGRAKNRRIELIVKGLKK